MTDTRTASAGRTASTPPGGRTGSSRPARRTGKAPAGSWPVRERSLVKPVLGIPPLAAVGLAVGLTAVGVVADLLRLGTVGAIFEVGYFLGCVLAVAWVRRRSIFVPAVQPPLMLAVVIPVIAVLVGAPTPEAGATEHLLMAGAPLINAFPAMAVTTLVVLLVAGFRLVRQRTGPDDAVGQLRRRLSGSRSENAAPDGDTGRERPSGRTTTRPDRARPTAADTATSAADRASARGRGRRTSAPETGARATGARTSGASVRAASGRPAPRSGTSRSTTGSTRADEPSRPRRPRRG
ncbi:hypothetical protein EV383_0842 [Pseudonocardia sediminis]|uniref:DUF6542 domain-containing protein n=1 Tax=Pseudonocardia sediminis TaxID=1397368 RepID=A0A4Q7UVC7_PSEST|nr:DUF6542 domain-containing protein [Pseudonocardia sediminis]RZT84009.1 hypothetical protein EV383_0842 [Pseudonocardia sediminis]